VQPSYHVWNWNEMPSVLHVYLRSNPFWLSKVHEKRVEGVRQVVSWQEPQAKPGAKDVNANRLPFYASLTHKLWCENDNSFFALNLEQRGGHFWLMENEKKEMKSWILSKKTILTKQENHNLNPCLSVCVCVCKFIKGEEFWWQVVVLVPSTLKSQTEFA